MKKSFSTASLIGALTGVALIGAAMGVYFILRRDENMQREIVSDTKNLTKNLKKKAQKKAKNMSKEDWIAQEKEKIMNHGR